MLAAPLTLQMGMEGERGSYRAMCDPAGPRPKEMFDGSQILGNSVAALCCLSWKGCVLVCLRQCATQNFFAANLSDFFLVYYIDIRWYQEMDLKSAPWVKKQDKETPAWGMHSWYQCRATAGLAKLGVPLSGDIITPLHPKFVRGLHGIVPCSPHHEVPPMRPPSLTALAQAEQKPSLLFAPATAP